VLEFREKVRLEMAVSEPFVEPTIKAIITSAATGQVGDGKIFVQHLARSCGSARAKWTPPRSQP